MDAVTHLAPTVGVLAACDVLGVARASFYRQRPIFGPPVSSASESAFPAERPAPARSLSAVERAGVLNVLHATGQTIFFGCGFLLVRCACHGRQGQEEKYAGEQRNQIFHAHHPPLISRYASLSLAPRCALLIMGSTASQQKYGRKSACCETR